MILMSSFLIKNLNLLIQEVDFELIKLTSWFLANGLSINIKKTKNIIITLDCLIVKLCDHTLAPFWKVTLFF